MRGERRSLEGGGRHLDHDPDLELGRFSPAGQLDRFVQNPSRPNQFVQGADHWEHHAHRDVVGHPDDREQLVGQQPGANQGQADAAHAQERVGLGRPR